MKRELSQEQREINRLSHIIEQQKTLQDDTFKHLSRVIKQRNDCVKVLQKLEPLFDYPPPGYERECASAQSVLNRMEYEKKGKQ